MRIYAAIAALVTICSLIGMISTFGWLGGLGLISLGVWAQLMAARALYMTPVAPRTVGAKQLGHSVAK